MNHTSRAASSAGSASQRVEHCLPGLRAAGRGHRQRSSWLGTPPTSSTAKPLPGALVATRTSPDQRGPGGGAPDELGYVLTAFARHRADVDHHTHQPRAAG
jgi:hypothetical protein